MGVPLGAASGLATQRVALLKRADVVCFQETKLRRCDLERDLCIVEGW